MRRMTSPCDNCAHMRLNNFRMWCGKYNKACQHCGYVCEKLLPRLSQTLE